MLRLSDGGDNPKNERSVTMKLMTPMEIGGLRLPNRILMAPMTRSRSVDRGIPTALNAVYYAQRASAGLIITEAAQVSAQGVGYPWTPGIHTDDQVAGWRRVTDAVHEAGGRIYIQLFHCGRISHPDFHNGESPVAPSAVRPAGEVFTPMGMKAFETPRPLETAEIPEVIDQFARGASNAAAAGFDGVEIHAANGYLPHQFLCDGTNRRTDGYGGSVENRCRFVLELTEAVVGAWDPRRTGIRLSPSGRFNDMDDSDPVTLFDHLVGRLDGFGLAFLHVMEPLMPVDHLPQYLTQITPHYRRIFSGPLITNGGFDGDSGEAVVAGGHADAVAYGKWFLANPDLPERLAKRAPLNEPDESTFYGGDEKGYTDYPFIG
jgi:N-ethylmaleimide reductase